MQCKISCSFGEIIDKVSILNIKQRYIRDAVALDHVRKEISIIKSENPMVEEPDALFTELSIVNQTLWNLEDNIREKSKKKEFDKQYIEYAEQIHIQNDKRYSIKTKINEKYNSYLKEEKIYNTSVDIKDLKKLKIGKHLYNSGSYNLSLTCIQSLICKYKKYDKLDSFYIDLLFSYYTICSIYNQPYEYFNTIQRIMSNIDSIHISDEQKYHCKQIYTLMCLKQHLYPESYTFLNTINVVKGPGISYQTMSFFSKHDKDKTLLLYEGGGIGDFIMKSRFIPELCSKYNENKIIFLVMDRLVWLFQHWFKSIPNLHVISYKERRRIECSEFDYHCSLLCLLKYLNITYDTLYLPTFYKDVNITVRPAIDMIIRSFQKKTYILNWKGNSANILEQTRTMDIVNAIPLFKIRNIEWVVIAKEINEYEEIILKQYNIKYIGNTIDKEDAFYDTIPILKHVEGVISTDTSLPHLSLSLGIKTYVLLSSGSEWRWGNDSTNWYSEAILIRQKEFGNWSYPVKTLIELLKKEL